MFDFSFDENEEIQRLHEEVQKMKEEFLIRSRRLYLCQLELEKKLHFLHEEKLVLSERVEKLEYLNSKISPNSSLRPQSRDFSFSNFGTEETFSFGEVDENVENSRSPANSAHKTIEIPYIFAPNHTGFEITKDFPVVIGKIIAERYRIDRIIANTQNSCVLACMDLTKKIKVCVKVVENDKASFERGLNEIRVLETLKNSCRDVSKFFIVKLLNYFYFKEHLFIVQELLLESLTVFQESLFSDNEKIKDMTRQLLQALDLLSTNGFIHCDLNPGNILTVKKLKEDPPQYRLINFNSAITGKDSELHNFPSLAYMAPEVTESVLSVKMDIWSLGCVVLECFLGRPLFKPLSKQELLYCIQETFGPIPGKTIENTCGWDTQNLDVFGEDLLFKDFISKIMDTDYHKRLTAKEALKHPWLDY